MTSTPLCNLYISTKTTEFELSETGKVAQPLEHTHFFDGIILLMCPCMKLKLSKIDKPSNVMNVGLINICFICILSFYT
jgi:hypothetical protein